MRGGLDLSGSREGAGGIGGLAFARTWQGPAAWTVAVPAFDGNGNLVELLDVSDGDPNAVASVASYQYDPYGNLLTSAGEAAEAFPLRFSSKYSDGETGLAYFGYRYYDSGMGRWMNRDPIGEIGGTNLYAYVENTPLEKIDWLGALTDLGVFRELFMHWWFPNGNALFARTGGEWGEYMMSQPNVKNVAYTELLLKAREKWALSREHACIDGVLATRERTVILEEISDSWYPWIRSSLNGVSYYIRGRYRVDACLGVTFYSMVHEVNDVGDFHLSKWDFILFLSMWVGEVAGEFGNVSESLRQYQPFPIKVSWGTEPIYFPADEDGGISGGCGGWPFERCIKTMRCTGACGTRTWKQNSCR